MTPTTGPAGPAHQPLSAGDRAVALAALADAHTFYRSRLDRSWVPDYLNRRHLYAQIVPARIGYAPGGWTTLRDYLRRQGHTDTTLQAAGLVRVTSNGRLVDVFRDRLMIPLRTPDGTLVGFSGRAAPIADATTPKYLNSPASDLFVKHEVLLGVAEDTAALRAGAMPVIVEGPLDRLAVAQATHPLTVVGVTPCGTALGPHQAAALLDAVGPRRPIAVMLDADPAGRAATRHAWEVLTDAGATQLRHVALPDGHDPADLVREGHGNLLQQAVHRSTPLAHAAADHTLTSTSTAVTKGDWQRGLLTARELFRHNLHRVPTDQVAAYVAHVADRLELPADVATAAAIDAVAIGPPRRHEQAHGAQAPALAVPAPPTLPRSAERHVVANER